MAQKNKRNAPPPDEPWIWLTRKMVESRAYQALGINARRVLDFLMIEHMAHAGTENGRLAAPYLQLMSFGVSRSEISGAIDDLEAFGWIEAKRGERQGGKNQVSRYRLTWLPTAEGLPETNRWAKVTEPAIRDHHEGRRRADALKRERKSKPGGLVVLDGGKQSLPTQILEGVREVEPEVVRKVELGFGGKPEAPSSESRTIPVRKVGPGSNFGH